MGQLSTHVLDTVNGRPAAGVRIELDRLEDNQRQCLVDTITNDDGRTDQPLLSTTQIQAGEYELRFHIGDYFSGSADEDSATPRPDFLDVVPIRFYIRDSDAKYHVPLLCSPWSYTTYRGS